MAITFPLTPPSSPGYIRSIFTPVSVVGASRSPYTGEQQIFVWPGQWSEFALTLPPMDEDVAALWAVHFMKARGPSGTFYFGPPNRVLPRGTISGSVTVGAGAVANDTVLPISGGSGAFAVGDWLQVGTTTAARLHRVLKVNAGSVDVFPVLRSAYANGTAITYVAPVGIFRLSDTFSEEYNEELICHGMDFKIVEAL